MMDVVNKFKSQILADFPLAKFFMFDPCQDIDEEGEQIIISTNIDISQIKINSKEDLKSDEYFVADGYKYVK